MQETHIISNAIHGLRNAVTSICFPPAIFIQFPSKCRIPNAFHDVNDEFEALGAADDQHQDQQPALLGIRLHSVSDAEAVALQQTKDDGNAAIGRRHGDDGRDQEPEGRRYFRRVGSGVEDQGMDERRDEDMSAEETSDEERRQGEPLYKTEDIFVFADFHFADAKE